MAETHTVFHPFDSIGFSIVVDLDDAVSIFDRSQSRFTVPNSCARGSRLEAFGEGKK